jgi:phosphoribosylglycinamide formyltransferase-1
MRATLEEHRVDLVVLAGFLRKIGPRTLEAFKGRIINTHPAPLPRFGGQGMYGEHVHQAVLDAGVPESAATVHWADAEYDTGSVIAVERVPVLAADDVPSLRARVQAVEKDLLIQTINRLLRTRAAPPGARGARARG